MIREILFPPSCLFCGEIIAIGKQCEKCEEESKSHRFTHETLCASLSKRVLQYVDGVCCVFLYDEMIANTVACYKFKGELNLADVMARYMAEELKCTFPDMVFDIAVCVPSFRNKNRHSHLLAAYTAQRANISYAKRLLYKTRKTEKQHELSGEQRKTNIKDAFAVQNNDMVKDRTVLLCDDVITSGNTVNECAKALKKAGAKQVYVCAFSGTL